MLFNSQVIEQVRNNDPRHDPHIHFAVDPLVQDTLLLFGILGSDYIFLHITLILDHVLIGHLIRVLSSLFIVKRLLVDWSDKWRGGRSEIGGLYTFHLIVWSDQLVHSHVRCIPICRPLHPVPTQELPAHEEVGEW